MASTLQISLVAVVVLFAIFHMGLGLNCIVCKTAEECAKNTSVTCTATTGDHCLKINNGKDEAIKEKKCGTTTECDDWKNCYACKDKDDCNSSSNVMPSFLLMGIVSTIIAKRYIM